MIRITGKKKADHETDDEEREGGEGERMTDIRRIRRREMSKKRRTGIVRPDCLAKRGTTRRKKSDWNYQHLPRQQ